MRRRSKAGDQVKKQHRKAMTLKRRNAPKAVRRHSSSVEGQETEVARLTRERDEAREQLSEALEQQTATSDVLRVISSSPGELEPVFQAMLENATRLCEAQFGVLNLYENGALRMGAMHNVPSAFAEFLQSRPAGYQPMPNSLLARVMRTRQVCSSADTAAENVGGRARALGGARSIVCVPMLKDDALIGTITIYRQEVRPFSDKQIELVRNFAAQAVIAIENTRLLNELRELLQQQTATADVLRVISSSPGELEPVFQSMLENAVRICDAKFGFLQLYEKGTFHLGVMHNAPPAFSEAIARRGPTAPGPLTPLARVAATKKLVHVADYLEEPAYKERDPSVVKMVELAAARSVVIVPMLKENELVGAIHIYRQEVRPFTDKQIALVQNFAAQAVIAIENTRLLNELRQRTTDLTEFLEQQTATSEVLRVISSSPSELGPVFQTILQNATTLCEARFGALALCEGDAVRIRSLHNAPSAFAEFANRGPFHPGPKVPLSRAIRTKQVVHVADIREDAAIGQY